MKITFLGTGTSQGVPVIACDCEVCVSSNPKDNRLRVSVLVEVDDKVIVIDSGPDFRQQMLRANVKKLDAVLFTHEHKDHVAGLDDIRAFNYLHEKPMDVFADTRVQEALKREFHYIFSEYKYPGIPKLNIHTINSEPFDVEGVKIIPIEVMHHKLPILGFRIGDFSYVTDANFISTSEKEKLKGSKVLVLNALRREEHISHFTLMQALELIKELKPEKTYLTHISHQLGLHDVINAELPANVECAYDGLVISLE